MTGADALTLGRLLARQGEAERAEAALFEASLDEVTAFEALEALGDLYRDNGLMNEAAGCFERAIALEPLPSLHVRLAECRLAESDFEAAEAAADKALRSAARPLVAYVLLGHALAGQGKRQPAIAAFETAVARERDWAAARYFLAEQLVAAGEHARAAGQLQMLATIAPDYAPGFVLAAEAALARRDDRQAVVEFVKAAGLAPLDPGHYQALGAAAERLGDDETALAAYESALRADAGAIESALSAARLAERRGWAAIARAHWRVLTYVAAHRDAATEAIARLGDRPDAPGAPTFGPGPIPFALPATLERPTGPLPGSGRLGAAAMPITQPLPRPGAGPALDAKVPQRATAFKPSGPLPGASPRPAAGTDPLPPIAPLSGPLPGSGPLGGGPLGTSTSKLRMGSFKPTPLPGAKPPAPRPPERDA